MAGKGRNHHEMVQRNMCAELGHQAAYDVENVFLWNHIRGCRTSDSHSRSELFVAAYFFTGTSNDYCYANLNLKKVKHQFLVMIKKD